VSSIVLSAIRLQRAALIFGSAGTHAEWDRIKAVGRERRIKRNDTRQSASKEMAAIDRHGVRMMRLGG
jgi:hypothetical protein